MPPPTVSIQSTAGDRSERKLSLSLSWQGREVPWEGSPGHADGAKVKAMMAGWQLPAQQAPRGTRSRQECDRQTDAAGKGAAQGSARHGLVLLG